MHIPDIQGPKLTPRYVEDFPTTWKHDLSTSGVTLESWSQGFMVGALLMMILVTLATMKRRLLHKLILVELLLAISHGTFCFMDFPGYGWYVSATAVLLYSSWYLHNIIAWLKTRPFLSTLQSRIYLFSFLIVTPYWIIESYGNFAFNNNLGLLFAKTRPFEVLFRDPWWVFTCCNLVYNIRNRYNFKYHKVMRLCPRVSIMLLSMLFSLIFGLMDILATVVGFGANKGINPYWKLSLVFKCFCDIVILDDFKSALDKIRQQALNATKGGESFRMQMPTREQSSTPDITYPSRTTSMQKDRYLGGHKDQYLGGHDDLSVTRLTMPHAV